MHSERSDSRDKRKSHGANIAALLTTVSIVTGSNAPHIHPVENNHKWFHEPDIHAKLSGDASLAVSPAPILPSATVQPIPQPTEMEQNKKNTLEIKPELEQKKRILDHKDLAAPNDKGFYERSERFPVRGSDEEFLSDGNFLSFAQVKERIDKTPFAGDKNALYILQLARYYQVNPLLPLGVIRFETENGMTGAGPPAPARGTRTPADYPAGCYNLTNMRLGGIGSIARLHGAVRSEYACEFKPSGLPPTYYAMFPDYPSSLAATFHVLDTYMQKGIGTIPSMADVFCPATDGSLGTSRGYRLNAEWKNSVSQYVYSGAGSGRNK